MAFLCYVVVIQSRIIVGQRHFGHQATDIEA